MKKKLAKELRKIAREMPVIMRGSHEVHFVKGHEMLANGVFDIPNPNAGKPGQPDRIKVQPDLLYKQPVPVQTAVNHTRKLKKLYKQMGEVGLHGYVDAVIKHSAGMDGQVQASTHLDK